MKFKLKKWEKEIAKRRKDYREDYYAWLFQQSDKKIKQFKKLLSKK